MPGYFSQSFGLVQAERRANGWPIPSKPTSKAISGPVMYVMYLNAASGAFVLAEMFCRL